MIIVKLLVADKEQASVVASSILKNKFTLTVFSSSFDSFHVTSSNTIEQTAVYVIQFVTKSMLFTEMEESLKKEFPQTEFYICATPIVHMAINLHNKVRERVIGPNLIKESPEE
jgi:phosphoglycerol transferase MdoB-like AlkP superfamily enzyme